VRWVPVQVLAGALALASLAGCGLGAGRSPTGTRLLVTRDFGARPVRQASTPKVSGQQTAMSLLMRNATVTTRFGGGFVQSIDGLAGGQQDGQPTDWFYYVNGVEAPKGAAETDVHPGDSIWWDLHDWSQTEDVPAVVGSYPEPFLSGIEGKRLPVRIECAEVQSQACRTVTSRLRALGVPAALSTVVNGEAQNILRVLVGPFSTLDSDPGAQNIQNGPQHSGVYARFAAAGRSLALLDADGHTTRTLGSGAGLIAATRYAQDAPEWLVTGTDAAGVQLAARDFNQMSLHDHFAVAVAESAVVLALPETGP
jgi:hypothetical protein